MSFLNQLTNIFNVNVNEMFLSCNHSVTCHVPHIRQFLKEWPPHPSYVIKVKQPSLNSLKDFLHSKFALFTYEHNVYDILHQLDHENIITTDTIQGNILL